MFAFSLGIYTVVYSLMGSVVPQEGKTPFSVDVSSDPSGAQNLTISMDARNRGFSRLGLR
ncbi:MAG: hypothetical protein ACE5OY_06600 [Candidatus Bathyarchaeia archaeon]